MKKTIFAGVCALLLCALPAGAQWGPRTIPEPTDGLKDAYKDYFKIGVAVNNRNVADPDQIKVILREYNSITAENAMNLGYQFPQALLRKVHLSSASIALQGSNLFTISDLTDMDPEQTTRGYPIQRSYGLTLNLGF